MGTRPSVRYSSLPQDEDSALRIYRTSDGPIEDLRYAYTLKEEIPWQSIFLAFFLLVFGTLFLILAHFLLTGHMKGESSQGFGFLVLGCLLFLPGFYETRIAYYAWRGMKGYSFSRIPAM
ncbi:hypothetical protein CBR_g61519 [Chara braunii]|uniref:Uncharacterized protein n=1 Tax=Chara braunii TaxID=69332 RepID=A0A388K8X6_CHABU|nr:hypothetical protein CBR_g61519 [Chara braunii]|eukprot:GBG66476.1 hypothetical protein CBR_g61519 [Chara braunii]